MLGPRTGTPALLLVVALVVVTATAMTASPARAANLPPGCHIAKDANGIPYVECGDSDISGGTTSSASSTSAGQAEGSGEGSGSSPDKPVSYPTYDNVQCVSPPSPSAPPAGTTIDGTQVPGSVVMWCESGIDGGPPFYFWSPSAAPPPPVDLIALSREARARIPIPQFTLEFGPKADQLAVNMTTTFNAVPDRSMSLSSSASDRGITVTVSGQLQGMTWYSGEPVECTAGDRTRPCTGGSASPVTCVNTACSYVYRWVSSRARTGGDPVWRVTVIATWQFTYSTAIAGGAATTGATTATWAETMPGGAGAVSMGEWSTVGGFEK